MAEFYPLSSFENYALWRKLNQLRSLPRIDGIPSWRIFEKRVAGLLRQVGCTPQVGPTLLKGTSGRHQFEIIVKPPRTVLNDFILVECKYRRIGTVVSKPEIMVFNQKALDISSKGRIDSVPLDNLYRVLILNVPLDHTAFRFCLVNGIKVVMPFYGMEDYPRNVAVVIPLEAAYCRLVDRMIHNGRELCIHAAELMTRLYRFSKQVWLPVEQAPRPRLSGYYLEKKYFFLLREAYSMIGERW